MRGLRQRRSAVGGCSDLDHRRGAHFQRGPEHESNDNDRRSHHGRPNNNGAADHHHDAADNNRPSHHGRPNNNGAADHYHSAADHYHSAASHYHHRRAPTGGFHR